MNEEKFNIFVGDVIAGKDMTLEVAIVLVEGLFNKYYLEDGLKITIQKVKNERSK